MTASPSVLTFRLKNIRLCQSALVVRLGDFRLKLQYREHLSGTAVDGTSVSAFKVKSG